MVEKLNPQYTGIEAQPEIAETIYFYTQEPVIGSDKVDLVARRGQIVAEYSDPDGEQLVYEIGNERIPDPDRAYSVPPSRIYQEVEVLKMLGRIAQKPGFNLERVFTKGKGNSSLAMAMSLIEAQELAKQSS